MRSTASAFLGLALLLFGNLSWGQTNPVSSQEQSAPTEGKKEKKSDSENAWSQFFFEEFLLRSCDDPTLRSAIALPQPKLTVTVNEDEDAKVTGRIGLRIAERFVFDVEAISQGKPSEEETTLASLDGLPNGSSAKLKLSWFGWGPQNYSTEKLTEAWCKDKRGVAYDKMMNVICGSVGTKDSICKAFDERNAAKNTSGQTNQNTEGAKAEDDDPVCKALSEKKKKASESANDTDSQAEDEKIGSITNYMKSPARRPSAIAILGKDKYDEAAEAYTEWLQQHDIFIPVLTLNANAKNNELKFFTRSAGPPAGLKETSEFHTDFDLVASGGAYLWGRFYAAANYRRGNEYLDGAKQEFCTPVGPASILNCINLTIAPPIRQKPEVLEFEVRGPIGRLGIGANVIRDLEANVTKVELPIFLLQKMGNFKMELNLGAKAEWRSDTKKFAFSVFAGPALSSVFRMFNSQNQN